MRDRVQLWRQLLSDDHAAAVRVCDLIVQSQPVRQKLLLRLERTTRQEWSYVRKNDRRIPRLRFDFSDYTE